MEQARTYTSPSKKICLTKVKFKCTDVENDDFITMKKIVGLDVLLSYPNLSEIFIIHTDASKTHLGGVFSQNGKPIAFYSRKFIPAQVSIWGKDMGAVGSNGD